MKLQSILFLFLLISFFSISCQNEKKPQVKVDKKTEKQDQKIELKETNKKK